MNGLKRGIAILWMTLMSPVVAAGVPAQLYKDPNCGCCEEYGKYLRANGYDVEVIPTRDPAAIKKEYNVPNHLHGCHTTIINGYVFEGHIPAEAINRFLQERPSAKGLSVPGMPPGSPGMGGRKKGPLKVFYVEEEKQRVYSVH